MNKAYLWMVLALLASACQKDNRERLFELFYPNFQFTINAGASSVLPQSAVKTGVQTNIGFYLRENNLDTATITAISPISARLTSLNGFDYDFMDFISVRICEDTEEPCREADEIFYIDRLQQNRPGERIELLPGLRNARRDLLRERYRLEVVMKYFYPPPTDVETQFDMAFQALR